MYLSATLILASLSLVVVATPTKRSGFAIPITRRSRVLDANGDVDIARLRRGVSHSIKKIHRGFQAYEKNTGAGHPSAPKVKLLEKRNIGSETLVDLDWYGSISVGTPAKTFTVIFDTGSSDLFLPASTCDSSCNGHMLYDPSESSTGHNLGKSFFKGYVDGSSSKGMLYTDDVTIASYTARSLRFGVATSYSASFKYPGWRPDGLLGLAFPKLSDYGHGAVPFFNTLVAEGVLPTNSFGLCPSELYIGGTNSKFYTGDFTYVPVTHDAFWQTNIDALYLNGKKIAGTTAAIIDSGTTMILGDSKTVQALYDQIPGSYLVSGQSSYYSMPCSFNSSITFQFGAGSFTLRPGTFNVGPYSSDPNVCIGGILAAKDTSFWVLGDVFLKNVYTEFDVGNKRLGFATAA